MRLLHHLCIASLIALQVVASSPTWSNNVIQSFPKTWLENVAARPNGHLLITSTIPHAFVREIDPTVKNPPAPIIHNFTSALACLGIAQVAFDEFAVVVGNTTLTDLDGGAGSFEIWTLKFGSGGHQGAGGLPTAAKAATIDDSSMLNGMLTFTENVVLVADSVDGSVFKVDIRSGEYTKIIAGEPLMKPLSGPGSLGLGINGIKIRDGMLYWTNTDQALLAGMPIRADGSKGGDAKVIAANLTNPDDFTVAGSHGGEPVFLVAGFDQVRMVKDGTTIVVANGSSVAGSTSLTGVGGKFYVVTSGGGLQWLEGNVTSPGVMDELVPWSGYSM